MNNQRKQKKLNVPSVPTKIQRYKDTKIDSLERQILGYKRNMTEDQTKIATLEKDLELFFKIKAYVESREGEWPWLKEQALEFDKTKDE